VSNIRKSIIQGLQNLLDTAAPKDVTATPAGGGKTALDINVAAGLDRTAFGELSIAQPSPQVQVQFPYNINSTQVLAIPINGASVTNGNGHANMSSGTNAAGNGFMLTNDVVRYNPGQGILFRGAGSFTTGVADSEQLIGIGSTLDGFFFGYDGTDFGALRRARGELEFRLLEITTASTTAEDITITLDGVAVTTVTVSNSGDPCITAREIAEHSYFTTGDGWGASHYGPYVEFNTVLPGSKSGTYSLSGATTAIGTFTSTIVGADATDSWIPQASWNFDTMDGNGPSGMTIDPTKGNVFQVRFQWLGYGAVKYYIENSETGEFQLVHIIKYANTANETTLANPSMSLWASSKNMGNTSDLTVKVSSMGGFLEGSSENLGPSFSVDNEIAHTTTDERPIFTIRNKRTYHDKINRVRTQMNFVTLTSALNSATAVTVFRIYLNATPENNCTYSDVSTNSSVTQFDSDALDFDTTDARAVLTFVVGASDTEFIELNAIASKLNPGNTVTITAQPSKSHASNEVGATLNWKELF